jgi:hypothetical protein
LSKFLCDVQEIICEKINLSVPEKEKTGKRGCGKTSQKFAGFWNFQLWHVLLFLDASAAVDATAHDASTPHREGFSRLLNF